MPSSLRPELAKGKVLVTNWHWFSSGGGSAERRWCDRWSSWAPKAPRRLREDRLGDLWDDEPLMVLNDEGHHAYRPAPVGEDEKLTAEEKEDREEATVWVSGLDKINAACGIGIVRRSVGDAFLHPRQWLPRRLAVPVDRQRLLVWWMRSKAASQRFRACRRSTTPAGRTRSISSCGSTSLAI